MKVSIITVNYNDCLGLNQTIKSINNIDVAYRSYFEHIIIDGFSNDNSIKLLNSHRQNEYLNTTIVIEKDKGIYDAMNKGVGYSTGNYCFFLNSGDLIEKDVDFSIFFATVAKMSEDDKVCGIAFNVTMENKDSSYLVKSRFVNLKRIRMPSVHQGLLYKTNYLKKFPYDIRLRICGDFKSVVVALENYYQFVPVDLNFTILTYGGISSQKPFLLLKESLRLIFSSSAKFFDKCVSCFFIIINVTLFQIYFRIIKLLRGKV